MRSYVRDTTDLILKLQRITENLENRSLVVFDVGNMYNNIRRVVVRAVHEYLEQNRPHGVTPFNPIIISLLELRLE